MGVGAGLYMYDVVVKSSRSLTQLLMSSCTLCNFHQPSSYFSSSTSALHFPLLYFRLKGNMQRFFTKLMKVVSSSLLQY